MAICLCFSFICRAEEWKAPGSKCAFADVTAAAGLSLYRNVSGTPEKRYILETLGSGVCLLDYDRDGWLDVLFVSGGDFQTARGAKPPLGDKLFRNRGDGSFAEVGARAGLKGARWGFGCAVADYDNDGWDDIYITAFGPNLLYRNNGDGTFSEVAARAGVGDERWGAGAAWGDYDNDGDLDLFVPNYVELDLERLPEPDGRNVAAPHFCRYRGIAVMCGPRGLAGAGDVLYRNNGDRTFTDVSKQAGVSDDSGFYGLQAVWGDYDNDGDLDIYVANDSTANYLYRNNGDGTFTEIGYQAGVALNEEGREQAAMGIAWGDYDDDGHMDIYITNFSDDTNTLYRNEGNGFFSDVTSETGHTLTLPYLGWGTAFFDYDNDGDLDLLAVNGHVYPEVDRHNVGTSYRQRNLLLENRGGKFSLANESAGPAFLVERLGRGAAVGDLDNDGDLDIVVNNMDDAPLLLLNQQGNENNWLSLVLVGRRSNRNGVGARARLVVDGRARIADVQAGGSYLSQHDMRLHFGLGRAERVELIEVIWPSGTKTVLKDIKANQRLVIAERE